MENSSFQQQPFDSCVNNSTSPCFGEIAHLVILGLSGFNGMIANGLLAVAITKQQKNRKTRDGILILNLVISNVFSLLVNVPLESVIISKLELFFRCESTAAFFENLHGLFHFTVNFSTLFTLAVIAIERFDAITKLPGQSRISRRTCIVAVFCGWISSTALTVFLKIGPLKRNCVPLCSQSLGKSKDEDSLIKDSISVSLVTIWIVTCCTITCTKLVLASRSIKRHQQQIKDMFGQGKAMIEIRFTKTCIAIFLTFILLWLPYGLAVLTAAALESKPSLCAVYWTQSISHTSSSILPMVYIALDKRIQRFYKSIFRRSEVYPLPSRNTSR